MSKNGPVIESGELVEFLEFTKYVVGRHISLTVNQINRFISPYFPTYLTLFYISGVGLARFPRKKISAIFSQAIFLPNFRLKISF